MTGQEITALLARDITAHLATIDAAGYPHVTPLWFLWASDAFHLASDTGRPHLARLRANPRAGLVIDTEEQQRPDGERPNQQVRITGDAVLSPDPGGIWTTRIWAKYIDRLTPADAASRLGDRKRVLITITPRQIVAVASI